MKVDDLAQEIRRVDGNHDLGAGALAEALLPFVNKHLAVSSASEVLKPCARAHVTLNDDGLYAELEVLDGTHLQVEHSPIDLYAIALPLISRDGPHNPDCHRVWLARQLLDSKLDDEQAYSICCYSPAVSDIWKGKK